LLFLTEGKAETNGQKLKGNYLGEEPAVRVRFQKEARRWQY
jgi:hypothetical protein